MSSRKRFAAILLVVAMILSTTSLVAATATPVLTDIAGHAAETDIKYLAGLGVLAGYPDGTFRPNALLRRSEAVKIILTATGQAGLAGLLVGASPFTDVPGTHWASGYIALARNAGIVHGHGDGTFTPEAFVTYAEFAKMLVEAAGLDPAPGLTWPANYVSAAQTAGIVTTAEVPFFAAGMSAPRGDAARMTTNAVAEVRNPATGLTLAQSVFRQARTAAVAVTPAAVNLGAGRFTTLTAALVDAAGAAVTGVPVTWSSNNTAVAVVVGGVVSAVAPGTAVITATAEGRTATVAVSVFGAPTRLALAVSRTLVGNAVSRAVLTVTAQDILGSTSADFSGTVTLVSSNPAAVRLVASSVTLTNGVGSVEIISAAVGTAGSVISVSAAGLTGATMTVTPVAQVLTSVELAVDPGVLGADTVSVAGIRARALDQEGVVMTAPGTLTVRATLSATDAAFFTGATPGHRDLVAGDINWAWIAGALQARNIIGAATITGAVTAPAALTGVPVIGTSISTRVIGVPFQLAIDPITSVAAGATQTILVRVLDVNGSQITSMPSATTVTLMAGATAATGSPVTLAAGSAGVATFTFTRTLAGTQAYTASGTWGAASLVTATASGAFTVGTAAQVTVVATPATISANGVATTTLTATIRDAAANAVTTGTHAVTFTRTVANGATAAFETTTVNTVAGVASVVVTASTVPGPTDTFTVTAPGLTSGAPATVTSALIGAANNLLIPAPTAATVGTNMTVRANVRDHATAVVTSDNGRPVTLTVRRAGAVVATLTANTVHGVATFLVNQTISGAYSFTAASSGLVDAVAVTGTFNPGALAAVRLTSDLTTLGNGGHVAALTIGGADAHGNALTTWTARDFTLTASPATLGTLATPTALTAVTAPITDATFTSLAGIGTTVLTASSPGLTSASISITTLVVGVPASLRVEPTTSTLADNTALQTVQVTVLDAGGNRVTNDNTTSIVLATTGAATVVATPRIAEKGQATFTVRNATAQTVTYTATSGTLTTGHGTGTFHVGTLAELRIGAPVPTHIRGDGSSIASYVVRVTDTLGNTISTATGTVTFEITGGRDWATVLTPTLTIVGGTATAMVQSRSTPGIDAQMVTVQASTTTILRPDGAVATLATNDVLRVDGRMPSVTTMITAQVPAGGNLALVFSEALNAASRAAVEAAITAARTTGLLSYTWSAGDTTLTVANTGAITDFGTAPITVNITDLAGNTTLSAVIIDRP